MPKKEVKEIPGVTDKFVLGSTKSIMAKLTNFRQKNMLVMANTLV